MLPKKVVTAMRICISKKNFSSILTKLSYKKSTNTFVGSDSFMVFEFIPNQAIPSEDFFIEYDGIRALEKLLGNDKNNFATIWGNVELQDGKKLVHILAGNVNLYLELIQETFPDYSNLKLFEDAEGSVDEIAMNGQLKKFHRIAAILSDDPVGKVTGKYYTFEHEDEFGKYRLGLRRPLQE